MLERASTRLLESNGRRSTRLLESHTTLARQTGTVDATPPRQLKRLKEPRFRGPVARKKRLAERVGFEPTLPFRVNTLSKRAPSATRPSLRRTCCGGKQVGKLEGGVTVEPRELPVRFYGCPLRTAT